ncbi:TraC family protein, partial [Escherichia coli]
MGFPLFKKKVKPAISAETTVSAECTQHSGGGDAGTLPNLTRPGRMTRREEAKIYHAGPSIIDFLPWVEYLDEEQCLLLDDGVSVGAVYEVTPAATEGRTAERLEQIRDTVEDALQDSFDEYDTHPWVVQFFCQDENDVDAYLDHLRGYVKPHAQRTAFTEAWLGEMERHLRGIARPEGLFTDTLVTGQPWRGQQRRTRMVVYRRIGKNSHDPMPSVAMLNQVCERVVGALGGAGVR